MAKLKLLPISEKTVVLTVSLRWGWVKIGMEGKAGNETGGNVLQAH